MTGMFANSMLTYHKGQSNGSGLSPRLWARAYAQAMSPDGGVNAYSAGDDFTNFGLCAAVASNVGRYASAGGTYKSYEDTGGLITQVPTEVGGVVELSVDADDDQEAWLQSCGGTGTIAKVDSTAGQDKLLVFEARFCPTTALGNLFNGLSEEGLAAGDTITDAGALASKDFIGFAVFEATPTALSFVYRKAGQAMVTLIANAGTLVAGTYVKAGFVYDPMAPESKRISVFVNNVENATHVTATAIAAATFPNGEELAWLCGYKNVTDIGSIKCDWWNVYQER